MILFEYGNWEEIENAAALRKHLQTLWKQGVFLEDAVEVIDNEIDSEYQPFLQFDGNKIKANNYVGFIQHGKEIIEIYPKVFRNVYAGSAQKETMLRHVFYWLSYCKKWQYLFQEVEVDTMEIDSFPEMLIYLIANQFYKTLSTQYYAQYQQVEEPMYVPKGSINFKRYVKNSLSRGNFQKIECDHEPFHFDNKVNRILKYCTNLLLQRTYLYENQRILKDILSILEEVEDVVCTAQELEGLHFNSFFEEYAQLMESCKLILKQEIYAPNVETNRQFALLLPMEAVFEDFFAGFLQDKFRKKWKIEYQKSDAFLAKDAAGAKVFQLKHDIFLTEKSSQKRNLILDTKYKLRSLNANNRGIHSQDLYQMLSYAFRRACRHIILVYPNLSETLQSADSFEFVSEFVGQEKVYITAIEIPFWSMKHFKQLEESLIAAIENSVIVFTPFP